MKTSNFRSKSLVIFLLFILWSNFIYADSGTRHQINLSLTLSGHIMLGIGYDYCFDWNSKIRASVWIAPEKGFPYAYSGGYAYNFNGNPWRPELGIEYMVITSPPLEEGRKKISLLTLTPAMNYHINNREDIVSGRIWISYLLSRRKIAPTGLEFRYGRSF